MLMYREIVTKAVVGKGKIANTNEAVVSTSNIVSKVLGCWIINHYFVNSYEEGRVMARGKYDLHIWYGYGEDSDTAIHKQTIDYIEEYSLKMKHNENLTEENELSAKCIKYPVCSGLTLNSDGTISVIIDKELSLDVIGETTLKVQVTSSGEEWVNNEDIENIDTNYLNK